MFVEETDKLFRFVLDLDSLPLGVNFSAVKKLRLSFTRFGRDANYNTRITRTFVPLPQPPIECGETMFHVAHNLYLKHAPTIKAVEFRLLKLVTSEHLFNLGTWP